MAQSDNQYFVIKENGNSTIKLDVGVNTGSEPHPNSEWIVSLEIKDTNIMSEQAQATERLNRFTRKGNLPIENGVDRINALKEIASAIFVIHNIILNDNEMQTLGVVVNKFGINPKGNIAKELETKFLYKQIDGQPMSSSEAKK